MCCMVSNIQNQTFSFYQHTQTEINWEITDEVRKHEIQPNNHKSISNINMERPPRDVEEWRRGSRDAFSGAEKGLDWKNSVPHLPTTVACEVAGRGRDNAFLIRPQEPWIFLWMCQGWKEENALFTNGFCFVCLNLRNIPAVPLTISKLTPRREVEENNQGRGGVC